ncbi:hypothetical protein U2F26_34695 [Micromonospora sp. 4G57]|uniref:DUF4145 domain-containing protein n=1 Tax=Micromonospora sicca TaxID=2202420 RepID=A0ABU5JQ49_9ACTN|nr:MULTISPECIES: hypothetical protein [unclassified Micromonospora]MDZ5447793.1 hypothetical protein [Micromonospora sp. 4G57]MDZ5494519.1 hypothetical protein [Micromonospora sp. 4G53]
MSLWDPTRCRCTQAYEEWSVVERDIRQFLGLTMQFATQAYDQIYASIPPRHTNAPLDAPDRADIFYDRVGGLWPHDHEWMVCCATLRDAVSAFEVYVFEAVKEVAEERQVPRPQGWSTRTPGWKQLREYCLKQLEVLDPVTIEVQTVIDLRNLLTHRRGELRTAKDRAKFQFSAGAFPSDRVSLSPEEVENHCEALGSAARRFDAALWGDKADPEMPEGLEDLLLP